MTSSKTFRLFISSTFSDFSEERKVLHEKVFPAIEKHLLEKHSGWQFQPIDLRWGVSTEAQLDQKTLELCLNEVRACKHFPHPNFLILIGNRYGWVPLPYAIEENEYNALHAYISNKQPNDLKYLKYWYGLDTNHVPQSYVLRSRTDASKQNDLDSNLRHDFVTLNDPKKEYNIPWAKHEEILRKALQNAADDSGYFVTKDDHEYLKYFLSATEAEVEEGIFQYLQPTKFQTELKVEMKKEELDLPSLDRQYVHGWIREISNIKDLDIKQFPAKLYIDQNQSNVDAFKVNLKESILKSNLNDASITLTNDPNNPIDDTDYLKKFEEFVFEQIKASIEHQINEIKDITPLKQERSEQLRFRNLKTETFCGRTEELNAIDSYLANESTQPLMVHGVSGIGKSSIIAQSIIDAETSLTHSAIAYRFIGATASSSSIRNLLESLVEDLADQGVLARPESFENDTNQFNIQIKELLESIEKPTLIVLDALDQIQSNDYLMWLPRQLPTNLKIVLSTLDQVGYDHYYNLLKNKIEKSNQVEIKPLEEEGIAKKILKALLDKEYRTLTKDQYKYVLKQYKANGSSPLYLKIAFEEAKLWKSTDTKETLSNSRVQGIIKEFIDNLSKKYHHPAPIVHKILGLIAASRDGLSEKEILDLLSHNKKMMKVVSNEYWGVSKSGKEERFPLSVWARLHNQLSPFLNERQIDGENLITFFHRQITEAIRGYLYEPNKQALQTELADYFLSLQEKEKLWDKRYYNLHMLTETPYQLFHANDSERLREILFDLEFAGSVYDHHKQASFKSIMEQASQLDGITQDEIYPWESFYREKEHLISRVDEELWRPHQSLFQLAYEDGDDSSLSQASDYLLNRNRIDFIWLKKKNRLLSYLRSGAIKTVHPYNNLAKWCAQIDENVLVSYGEDCNVYLWDISSNILIKLGSFGDKKYLEFKIIKIPNGNFIIYNQLHESFDYDDYDETESLKDMHLKRKYLETNKKAYEIDKIGNVTLTYNFIDEYLENVFVVDENYLLFLYRNGKIFLFNKNNKNIIEYTKAHSYSEEYHSCLYFRNDQINFIDLNEKYLIEKYKDLVYFSTEINPFTTNNILLNSDSMLKAHEIEVDNSHYVKCESNGSLRLFKKSSLIKKNDSKDEIDEFSLTSLINMAFNGSTR